MLFPNFILPQDRTLRPRDFNRIREVGGSTLAASLTMTVSLFLGGKGQYTIDDVARDLDLGYLVLDTQDATELKTPECAIEGCTKFVYMTYQRTDNTGTPFAPQFACGVDYICPPGAVSDDFPLPECCLKKAVTTKSPRRSRWAKSSLLQGSLPHALWPRPPRSPTTVDEAGSLRPRRRSAYRSGDGLSSRTPEPPPKPR
jgi:hypothetical protein